MTAEEPKAAEAPEPPKAAEAPEQPKAVRPPPVSRPLAFKEQEELRRLLKAKFR